MEIDRPELALAAAADRGVLAAPTRTRSAERPWRFHSPRRGKPCRSDQHGGASRSPVSGLRLGRCSLMIVARVRRTEPRVRALRLRPCEDRGRSEVDHVRVLVVAIPASGHVNPLLPLAQALLAQGDEVVVASGEDPAGSIASSGAKHVQVGGTEMDWFQTLGGRVRGSPGDGIAPERINHYFVPRVFADIATIDMIDDVVAFGRRFDPDLVLFETYAFAGPLAAAVLGVPAVHHLISPMLPHEVMEL